MIHYNQKIRIGQWVDFTRTSRLLRALLLCWQSFPSSARPLTQDSSAASVLQKRWNCRRRGSGATGKVSSCILPLTLLCSCGTAAPVLAKGKVAEVFTGVGEELYWQTLMTLLVVVSVLLLWISVMEVLNTLKGVEEDLLALFPEEGNPPEVHRRTPGELSAEMVRLFGPDWFEVKDYVPTPHLPPTESPPHE